MPTWTRWILRLVVVALLPLGLGGCSLFRADPSDGEDSVQVDLEKVSAILTVVGNELVGEIAAKDPERAAKIGEALDLSETLVRAALRDYMDNGRFDLSAATPALVALRDAVLAELAESEMDPADRVKWERRVRSAETLVRLLVR